MKARENWLVRARLCRCVRKHQRIVCAIFFCLGWLVNFNSRAADNAALISSAITNGTEMMPRAIFTQTWTVQNTGTTTWTPNASGYTLNLIGKDSLGATPMFTNNLSTWYTPSAVIDSGKSVAPGAQATFSMNFIAPETAGSVTDTFQLNNQNGDAFGPNLTLQITVEKAGSTNQFDRARAVSYANNYAGYVCSDGYYWTNGSDYGDFGALAPVPTAELGDDCAHFISCCIGSQPNQWGGGLKIPSRVPPTYGEPGVARLVNTCLIAPGYAEEVFSLNDLEPGDLIAWNWEGDTNIADLDHATLYLGNGVLASHSASCLDVAPSFFQDSLPDWRWHLIHIFDSPTITTHAVGNNFVMSWTTNWTGYALYSSSTLGSDATWTKVTKTPVIKGTLNILTNSLNSASSGPVFYRLMRP
jgi:cell wall-associated NlpC family hydrolase